MMNLQMTYSRNLFVYHKPVIEKKQVVQMKLLAVHLMVECSTMKQMVVY